MGKTDSSVTALCISRAVPGLGDTQCLKRTEFLPLRSLHSSEGVTDKETCNTQGILMNALDKSKLG